MSKPIAQTFYINEPIGGVEGVVLTKVDIYFQSVSSTYGVELQIRTTENGNPTSLRLPDASKVLQVTDTYSNNTPIIRASTDASIPTTFVFDTPVTLQSQTSYALVIIPVGGNPDYTVWTAELGGTDITTASPITTNNDTGTLFLSSNDIQFTSVQSEDIKFTIYTANFTSTTGTAVYEMFDEENITYNNLVGSFIPNEKMFMSQTAFNIATLNLNANTGSLNVGEVLYQSNGSANVATGIVYSANSSKVLVTNTVGTWTQSNGSSGYQITGKVSLATGNVASVVQTCNAFSNSIVLVPFTGNTSANIFYANQTVYVTTSNRSKVDVRVVTSVVNSTAIAISSNNSFSDNSATIGQVRGDLGKLFGFYSGPQAAAPNSRSTVMSCFFWGSTANNTVDFSNSHGQLIIGSDSGSSAVAQSTTNLPYNAVVPQMSESQSQTTNIDWTFTGIDFSQNQDSTQISMVNNIEKELLDKTRYIKSRSDEIHYNAGAYTTKLYANLYTANTKLSPYIDGMRNYITFTRNAVLGANQVSGYVVNVSNTVGGVFIGGVNKFTAIQQSNGSVTVTGNLLAANSTVMYISNTSGPILPGYTITKVSNTSVNTYVNSVYAYNEMYSSNVVPSASRYISKNVVLADKQDAEDLQVYLTAYRPAQTNFQVYGKIINAQDSDTFTNKIWSRLPEVSSPALISSGSNPDDFVELQYGLPTSLLIAANSTTTSTTSANVTVSTTSGVSNGNFIYLYNTSSNNFIVRQVSYVANNTTLVLTNNPSFSSTNADFGTIPGLEHPTGAFLFANNLGIVRYVSSTDTVYDSYKTFAIKIVPTAENDALVPRAADMRALALQV